MPTQKIGKHQIRKLMRSGSGSLVVSIPKEITQQFKWKEKQKVVVKRIHGGITIKDWKR